MTFSSGVNIADPAGRHRKIDIFHICGDFIADTIDI